MKKLIALLAVTCLCVLSCTTKFNTKDLQEDIHKLERNQAIYVALPDDGKFDGRTYTGTGKQVADIITSNLRKYTSTVYQAQTLIQAPEAFEEAAAKEATYLLVPRIIHWEPRAAAWSMIAPEAKISITVYDVRSRERLVDKQLDIKGRTMTWVSQHIDRLVEELLPGLIDTLY